MTSLNKLSLALSHLDFQDDRGKNLSRSEIESLLFTFNSYLLSILDYKLQNRDLAEEILQETYLSLLRKLRAEKIRFLNEKKLKNYLVTIAVNKVRDYFRSHGRLAERLHVFSSTEELDQFLYNRDNGEENPEEIFLKKEREKSVTRAVNFSLEQLPGKYREILLLKYRGELSNGEIAEKLNMSLKGCESLLFRAKKAFKKELEKNALKGNGLPP